MVYLKINENKFEGLKQTWSKSIFFEQPKEEKNRKRRKERWQFTNKGINIEKMKTNKDYTDAFRETRGLAWTLMGQALALY